MGYNAEMVAFKKKELEEIQKYVPEYTYDDMFIEYLSINMYTASKNNSAENDVDITANWIYSPNKDVFSDFFTSKNIEFNNGDSVVINEDIYNDFYVWIKNILSSLTLLDVTNRKGEKAYFDTLINTYKSMRDKPIDFETEFVVFQHDW